MTKIVSGQSHDSDQRAPSRLFFGPALPCSSLLSPGLWPFGLSSIQISSLVHGRPRLCFRDKGIPTDWTEAASRQLEELRPSLASCLPALQTATPISQLTPETSFPCCGSWRRPLRAPPPPKHPLSRSSWPARTRASRCSPVWRRLYHARSDGKEAQLWWADYSAGALQ